MCKNRLIRPSWWSGNAQVVHILAYNTWSQTYRVNYCPLGQQSSTYGFINDVSLLPRVKREVPRSRYSRFLFVQPYSFNIVLWQCLQNQEVACSATYRQGSKANYEPAVSSDSHFILLNPYSAGIDFRRQILTSIDVRFWRLKTSDSDV